MKKRILIASSLLSITLALAQPNILFAEDVAVAPVHVTESQSLASKKAGPSDEIKKQYLAKREELAVLKSRLKELRKNDPNGDFLITDANKDSFYATTNKDYIAHIAELSKEIYAAGEIDREEIQKKYDEKRQRLQLDIDLMNQKMNEYINLKEDIKAGGMSPANFMLVLRARFGSFITSDTDFSDVGNASKQSAALDKIRDIIAQQIDSANKSMDNMDIYYLYTQRLTVVNNHFKDYEVAKIFYRHGGSQFSGALLHNKTKNHLILVFPGTVTGADWGRNLQFIKHPGEFIPGQTLSLHSGFVNSYNEIRLQINTELNLWVEFYKKDLKNKGRVLEVTTTGHSKGAAMSTLAALDVAANLLPTHLGPKDGEFPWKVNNPNFASPRFAGTQTSKIVEEFLGKYNILRFVNYWDIVPSVVAEFTGSKHVGLGFVFNAGLFTDLTTSGPIVNWHSMGKYAELAPEEFEKSRKAGIEMSEVNAKMNALKKEVQEMKKQYGFKSNKGWFSAF